MLKVLRDEYAGDVHVSTGMTTKDEIEAVVKFFEEKDAAKSRLVIYNCTSGYPVPFKAPRPSGHAARQPRRRRSPARCPVFRAVA
eukprot:6194648-Pleurochrysis_carterae.AAC.1